MALSLICLTDGLGLAHVVQSYVGEAYISFTACRDILPDPEFYSQCLQDSFDELLVAAKALEATPPAAKSKPNTKTKTTKPAAKKRRAPQENA
jgi:hypothetical protein